MLTAIVLIQANVSKIAQVGEAVASISGVAEVYSVTGGIDLVAVVRVPQYESLEEVISNSIGKVDGIQSMNTHLAFRTYSTGDLEQAYDLGLD